MTQTRTKVLLSALFLGLSSLGATAQTVPLGPNPTLGGGSYSTGGGLTVAMEARDIDGRLGLCGVWAQSKQLTVYTRRAASRVLSKGSVVLGGEVITHNFDFLNRVNPAETYAGAPAGCVVLNRAWQAIDAAKPLDIRIPRQRVYTSSNEKGGASPRVFFARSEDNNPALAKGSLLPSRYSSFSSGAWSN